MPRDRMHVHRLLKDISQYGERVYYNPPENVKLSYPCIVYNMARLSAKHADNDPYFRHDVYTVTHIYQKVQDEKLTRKLADTKGFSFDRNFTNDNLHHDVFTLQIT